MKLTPHPEGYMNPWLCWILDKLGLKKKYAVKPWRPSLMGEAVDSIQYLYKLKDGQTLIVPCFNLTDLEIAERRKTVKDNFTGACPDVPCGIKVIHCYHKKN